MLVLVRSFSYTPQAMFGEDILYTPDDSFGEEFSYTPQALFSEELLLHSSSWF